MSAAPGAPPAGPAAAGASPPPPGGAPPQAGGGQNPIARLFMARVKTLAPEELQQLKVAIGSPAVMAIFDKVAPELAELFAGMRQGGAPPPGAGPMGAGAPPMQAPPPRPPMGGGGAGALSQIGM